MVAARLAARLHELTGADEDWIARAPDASGPRLCHELLARCLAPSDPDDRPPLDLVRGLTLAERDWLLLQLHERTFGRQIRGDVPCPACHTLNELCCDTRDLAGEAPAPQAVEVALPSGAHATLRALTAGDHEYFATLGHYDNGAQQDAAIARLLAPVQETQTRREALSADDRLAIVQAIEAAFPEPIELRVCCVACTATFTTPFEPVAFVIGELRAHSTTLLDDVHALATTYHWSESEVLRLPLGRRLAYLSRIDADRDRGLVHESGQ